MNRRAPSGSRPSTVLATALLSLLLALPVLPARGAELPIPERALWEAHMLSFGQTHCDYFLGSHTFDERLNHTYYDGERVFYQIADYTGDSAWNTCAHRAEAVYRDEYVFPSNGGLPGYWNFTTGLRMDYQRAGQTASRDAVVMLSENAAYAHDRPLDWTASADLSREVAYAIVSYINRNLIAPPVPAWQATRRTNFVNQAYDHMNQWFVRFAWPGPWQQSPMETGRLSPFMVGLTAHALIRDWEETGDARLIPALRLAAGWMWTNAWIPASEAMWYEYRATASQATARAIRLRISTC